jgi:hypothetical protein
MLFTTHTHNLFVEIYKFEVDNHIQIFDNHYSLDVKIELFTIHMFNLNTLIFFLKITIA